MILNTNKYQHKKTKHYAKFIKSLLQFLRAKNSAGIKYIKKLVMASITILMCIKNSRLLQGSNGYKSFAIFLGIIGTLVIILTPHEEVTRESIMEMLRPEEDLKRMFYEELQHIGESQVHVSSKNKISYKEEISNTNTRVNVQNLNVGFYIKASTKNLYVFEEASESISDVLFEYTSKATSKIVPINVFEYISLNSFSKEYLCNRFCLSLVLSTNENSNLRNRKSNSIDFIGGWVC